MRSRLLGMIRKEFIQMWRDRLTVDSVGLCQCCAMRPCGEGGPEDAEQGRVERGWQLVSVTEHSGVRRDGGQHRKGLFSIRLRSRDKHARTGLADDRGGRQHHP